MHKMIDDETIYGATTGFRRLSGVSASQALVADVNVRMYIHTYIIYIHTCT
jgi:hypothetical protein